VNAEDRGPLYSRIDYDQAARVGQVWESAGGTVFKTGMVVQEAVQKAETEANRQFALDRSIDYDKAINKIRARFQGLQGMDAVSAQPGAAELVYKTREEMGGNLPNKQAQEFFLARTAESAVGTDRSIQLHAATEWQSHQKSQMQAKRLGVLERVSALAADESGARDLALNELSENGEEIARMEGNTDPASITAAHNLAAADGAALIIARLVENENYQGLKNFMDHMSKEEGVIGALALKHPQAIGQAQDFVFKHRVAVNVALSLQGGKVPEVKDAEGNELVVPNPVMTLPGKNPQQFPPNAVDFGKAYANLRMLREKGVIKTDLEMEQATARLAAQAKIVQAAWREDGASRVSNIWGAYNAAPNAEAAKVAAESTTEWNWLSTFVPGYARRLEDYFDKKIQNENLYGPSRSSKTKDNVQRGVAIAFADQVNRDPSIVTETSPAHWLALTGGMHQTDKNYWDGERRRAQNAIKNGLMVPKIAASEFINVAATWDSGAFGKATGDWTPGDKRRFIAAQEMTLLWAQAQVEDRQKPVPLDEMKDQFKIYLSRVESKGVIYDSSLGGLAEVLQTAPNGMYRGEYASDADMALVNEKLKAAWIRQRKQIILDRGTITWKGKQGGEVAIGSGRYDIAKQYETLMAKGKPDEARALLDEAAEGEWALMLKNRPQPRFTPQLGGVTLPGTVNPDPLDIQMGAVYGSPDNVGVQRPLPPPPSFEAPADDAPDGGD
jgi:head-tail adaptor